MLREITRKHKGIYGYIENNNQIMLIIKRRGSYTGMYDLPGGSPEAGETEAETLKREIKEETSCDLADYSNRREKTIIFENFIEDDGRPGCLYHTGILFDCKISGTPDKNISDLDSNGALWIKKSELNKKKCHPFCSYLRRNI